eukprot:743821-Rhodomonas_salina.1
MSMQLEPPTEKDPDWQLVHPVPAATLPPSKSSSRVHVKQSSLFSHLAGALSQPHTRLLPSCSPARASPRLHTEHLS